LLDGALVHWCKLDYLQQVGDGCACFGGVFTRSLATVLWERGTSDARTFLVTEGGFGAPWGAPFADYAAVAGQAERGEIASVKIASQ
jgi:hypothetical protein